MGCPTVRRDESCRDVGRMMAGSSPLDIQTALRRSVPRGLCGEGQTCADFEHPILCAADGRLPAALTALFQRRSPSGGHNVDVRTVAGSIMGDPHRPESRSG